MAPGESWVRIRNLLAYKIVPLVSSSGDICSDLLRLCLLLKVDERRLHILGIWPCILPHMRLDKPPGDFTHHHSACRAHKYACIARASFLSAPIVALLDCRMMDINGGPTFAGGDLSEMEAVLDKLTMHKISNQQFLEDTLSMLDRLEYKLGMVLDEFFPDKVSVFHDTVMTTKSPLIKQKNLEVFVKGMWPQLMAKLQSTPKASSRRKSEDQRKRARPRSSGEAFKKKAKVERPESAAGVLMGAAPAAEGSVAPVSAISQAFCIPPSPCLQLTGSAL